jgi:hypothetical protein
MKPPARKSLPKKRNLAAKALREPLFRPKIMANPNAYKRKARFNQKPDDLPPEDEIS